MKEHSKRPEDLLNSSTPSRDDIEPLTKWARRSPSRWASIWLMAQMDLSVMSRSWLVRGFLIVSALLTVFTLKGMQSDQAVASKMLETIYATYVLVWMHGIIFIAGGALSREQDCLNDAILSRGVTRGEYMGGKLLARCLATLFLVGIVLLPSSLWAIRQDKLIRTETGYLTANAESVIIEPWEPKKVFAEIDGPILEMTWEVGDAVQTGEVLTLIDDRKLYGELETYRRAEQDALDEVDNSQRRYENAKRAVEQAEESLLRSERALFAKDLLSRLEQSDREGTLRLRKSEVKDTENEMRVSRDNIAKAERALENAKFNVIAARKRLGHATVTATVSGYLTEILIESSQHVGVGTQLFTIAPLDDYQLRVPIYNFNEFKRLEEDLSAYITIQGVEYIGRVERLGAMTQDDRWGRKSNYTIVRFKGDGTLGLLGLNADVRMTLPPKEEEKDLPSKLIDALTGHGEDDLETRTASVTQPWMALALAKVMGCVCLTVTLALFLASLLRNALTAILGTIGLWHISNFIFDFSGLRSISYLEIVRTMDKVLGGIATPSDELTSVAWMLGLSLLFALGSLCLFVYRDPPK